MKKIKILVIDDDSEFVEATTTLLTAKGYTVESANNGETGYAKAKQTKPDAIILDVMMSYDSEGFDIARKLREDNITKDIPIVMITGIRKTKSLPFSYEPDPDWLPVNEVLEKPIKPDQILNALEKALKK
jgi:CheY-like chemotaxis protein